MDDAKILNDRRRRFCELLVQGKSATQAYIGAGFSAKGAAQGAERLLRNVDIMAYVDKLRTASAERAGLTVDYVLDRLRENLERALQAQPVLDHDGKETGEYVYDGAVANRAAELLGKHLGMFSERLVIPDWSTVTDDELALLEKGQAPARLKLLA